MSIKLWDWEKDFDCIQTYEGHTHYVMMIKINPRDTNVFASASLDRSIKVWGLTADVAHFTLEGSSSHERGVNCIDYYPGGDKPYLISGADDRTVKIWDYQTKACIQTLEGHTHNVSAACFHPRLPLIVSASEDGTVRLWHSTTYRPETTLNYGMERVWSLAPTKDANKLAIGYDEGTVVIKLGNERPVASLDTSTGKLVWAVGHDIQTLSLKGLAKDGDLVDGERIPVNARDLGSCEVYPQTLLHNSNGGFVVVCGDGEYIIYTSQALRNKAFGSALDFVWSSTGTGDYAIRENISRIRTFKNFKENKVISLPISSAEGLYGGTCVGVKGADCIVFFDWDEGTLIRKIDVSPNHVYWNESGEYVVLICSEQYFVLKFSRDIVNAALASGNVNPEEGVDGSFELEETINDSVRTGQWVGDCFLYTNTSGKLNYYVGGEVMTLCHLNSPMYLLGYVPKEDRVFLIDTTYNIVSYKLLLNVLNYQTAVVRKDFETANIILASIPRTEHAGIARFLESQGFKEEALTVSTDLDHKFELAVDLRKMNVAHEVLVELEKKGDTTDTQSKWRRLGDLALSIGDITLGKQCADKSDDLSGLLLLFSSSGNKAEMISLAKRARAMGRYNVSFIAFFITNQIEDCIEMLIDTKRIPEAAFMARTYAPSEIPRVLELWKNDLKQINEKAADSLADPFKYPNLFPDLDYALKIEETFKSRRGSSILASSYPTAKADLELNLIELMKNNSISIDSAPAPAPAPAPVPVVPLSVPVLQEEPTISEEDPTISEEEPAVEEPTEEVIEEEVVENEIEDVEELENEEEQQKVVSDLNISNNEEDEDWA